jgi:hypothetical protein
MLVRVRSYSITTCKANSQQNAAMAPEFPPADWLI